MALKIIAEAVLRIEHKVDALLRHLKVESIPPMQFLGVSCPVCAMPIEYTVDVSAGVVVRRCNCKTGKVPATLPLLPVTTPGVPNGSPLESLTEAIDGAAKRPVRPAR